MSNSANRPLPPDQPERSKALDAEKCVLVKAPAGSGKTDLLTRRFLRLLSMVDEPGQIVAITFTKAAAAEMRNRILAEACGARTRIRATQRKITQKARSRWPRLAQQALERSQQAGWNLIDLPAQLRIMTIDAFCRELALQQPLLSGLGGGLDIAEQPKDLYRRAARQTLNAIGAADASCARRLRRCFCGATTVGRTWKTNCWRCWRDATAGCADSCSIAIRIGKSLRERLERPFDARSA